MTHIDDQTILRYVIDTLDEEERSAVLGHISACEQCMREAERTRSDVERISGFALHLPKTTPPPLMRRASPLAVIARMAAVLVVGFLLGYVTAEMSNPTVSIPVKERLLVSSADSHGPGYAPSEATAVNSAH